MPACSTFPVFPNTRPWGNVIFGGEGRRARGEASWFYPRSIRAASSLGCAPAKRSTGALVWSQRPGSGSVGERREVLVGAGLTWGTLPEAHGVAGRPLESGLQGLVSLPPGCREARVLCAHLHRQRGW